MGPPRSGMEVWRVRKEAPASLRLPMNVKSLFYALIVSLIGVLRVSGDKSRRRGQKWDRLGGASPCAQTRLAEDRPTLVQKPGSR